MPNVGSSQAVKRRLLSTVMESTLLHASPIWSKEGTKLACNRAAISIKGWELPPVTLLQNGFHGGGAYAGGGDPTGFMGRNEIGALPTEAARHQLGGDKKEGRGCDTKMDDRRMAVKVESWDRCSGMVKKGTAGRARWLGLD